MNARLASTRAWKPLAATLKRPGTGWTRMEIDSAKVEPATCRFCGATELPILWAVVRATSASLVLRCPDCERGLVRYRRRGSSARLRRAPVPMMVGVGFLLAIALFAGFGDRSAAVALAEDTADAFASLGLLHRIPTPLVSFQQGLEGEEWVVYVSRGDRRIDVERYAAHVVRTRGEGEARLLRSLEFDPVRNRTRVIVDPSSSTWRQRLHNVRGWTLDSSAR
jgi:hypothetical protein